MGTESRVFLFEAFDLIGNTTIVGVLYGITFILYCLCAWPLYLKLWSPDKRRRAGFSLGYISLLLLYSTVLLAVNTRVIQLAYIDHPDFPGGPLGYEGLGSNPGISSYSAVANILDLIVKVSTMAIQIWRLWVIWSGTQYAVVVTILPVLLFLTCIAIDVPANVIGAFLSFDQLGFSQMVGERMVIAFFAIMSTFTVLVTGLIATRLLARRQQMKILGMSEVASPYLNIVAMLVESYAVESTWTLATTISFALDSPSQFMLIANDSAVKIIAYFLILCRVETERGWTKQTEGKLTTLQWDHGIQTTTHEVSGVRSRVPATTTIVARDFLPVNHSDSAA